MHRHARHVDRLLILSLLTCFLSLSSRADDWPQWLGPRRDGVWREAGILEKFPQGGPTLRWKVPVGAGYASAAVANGRVYLTDRVLAQGTSSPQNPFARGSLAGVERVWCFKESDGSVLWKDEYPCPYTVSYAAGPRATPVVNEGKVYTLGAEGDLRCYDAGGGKLVWQVKLGGMGPEKIPAPVWGYSAHPLVEGDKLITLGPAREGPVVIAFDKNTGKPVWQALEAREPGYAPPMVYEAGGTRQLIIWHPQALVSLNPQTGQVYWTEPFESKQGMSIATPKLVKGEKGANLLLVTAFYNGAMAMKLTNDEPTATRLWKIGGRNERNTQALHSVMVTPYAKDGFVFGVDSYGQLRCLRADTGERVWETFAATTGDAGEARWACAFITPHEPSGHYFLFNERGELIVADLSPKGYAELSRAKLIEPTNVDAGRPVVWSHPAYANRCVFVRNDKELACYSLAGLP